MDASDKNTPNDNKDSSVDIQQNAPILVILDDDCLLEIFRQLDIDDLPSIANVCVRFNQNAKKIYSSKFRKTQIWFRNKGYDDWLLNFGSMMESVTIWTVEMLEKVGKHCTSLKDLRVKMSPFINYVQLDEKLMEKFQPLFAKLEKLTFENCLLMDHIKTGLIGCQQLKVLTIENKLLEESESELAMYDGDERDQRAELMPFANLHSSELFQSVGENTPNLEELQIHVKYMDDTSNFQRDVLSLCNLRSLKVLDMHIYGENASNLMKAFAENEIQIEDLKLKDGKIDIVGIESICKIKSLKKIAFYEFYGFDVEYLIPLAKDLPFLSSLDIEYPEFSGYYNNDRNITVLKKVLSHGKRLSNFSILNSNYEFRMHDYETILTIIQNRKEKFGLKISIGCNISEWEERFEMKTELENGERLEVCVHFY